jgi:hypothetical protein
MAVRIDRANLFVVLLQLAAFLPVQTDFPISQAVAIRAPVVAGACFARCCCPPDKQERGTCCCSSKGAHTKRGDLLRASRCREDGRTSDAPIVVKFQVTVPVLAAVQEWDVAFETTPKAVISASVRLIEPPDPPPRFLVG